MQSQTRHSLQSPARGGSWGDVSPPPSIKVLSVSPVCRDGAELRRMALGIDEVRGMYEEMKMMERHQQHEVALLERKVEDLQIALHDASAKTNYLEALAEKLRRKVERRDHTIESLERKLTAAREHAGTLDQSLLEASREVDRRDTAMHGILMEHQRLVNDNAAAQHGYEKAEQELADAECRMVQLRSSLLELEADTADNRSLLIRCAESHAEVAQLRLQLCLSAGRKAVAHALLGATKDDNVAAAARSILGVLRGNAAELAAGCRAAFLSAALAAPLAVSLRDVFQSTECGGQCTLAAHRALAACESALTTARTPALSR